MEIGGPGAQKRPPKKARNKAPINPWKRRKIGMETLKMEWLGNKVKEGKSPIGPNKGKPSRPCPKKPTPLEGRRMVTNLTLETKSDHPFLRIR